MKVERESRLAQAQHTLHQVHVGRAHIGRLTQVTLATLALFSQQVTLESMEVADFTGSSNFKRLFCATVRLYLGHDGNFFRTAKVGIIL